jgi:proteasome lid subunit RPN8/RPN11
LFVHAEVAVSPTAAFSVDPAVLRDIEDHVQSDTSLELGGVLVGTLDDSEGVEIDAAIPALEAEGPSDSISFTSRVWDDLSRKVDREHPNKRIVGWYHSSPGAGVVLSEHDFFIQQRFFHDPRMVELVIDPSSGEAGWFGWRGAAVEHIHDFQGAPTQLTRRRVIGLAAGGLLLTAGAFGVGYGLGHNGKSSGGAASGTAPATSPGKSPEPTPGSAPAGTTATDRGPGDPAPTPSTTPGPAPTTPGTASTPNATGPVLTMVSYTIVRGDTLWGIARRLYGDGLLYHRIIEANPGLTPAIEVGQVIRVPLTLEQTPNGLVLPQP